MQIYVLISWDQDCFSEVWLDLWPGHPVLFHLKLKYLPPSNNRDLPQYCVRCKLRVLFFSKKMQDLQDWQSQYCGSFAFGSPALVCSTESCRGRTPAALLQICIVACIHTAFFNRRVIAYMNKFWVTADFVVIFRIALIVYEIENLKKNFDFEVEFFS